MKSVRRGILYLVILAIPVAGLLYTAPRQAERLLPGIEYRLGDAETGTAVNVRFEGSLQRRFFDAQRFRGTIIIGDKVLEDVDVNLTQGGDLVMAKDPDTGERYRFGVFYAVSGLEKITFTVLEPVVVFGVTTDEKYWSLEDGLMISAPAANRSEALHVSNQLMGHLLEKPLE